MRGIVADGLAIKDTTAEVVHRNLPEMVTAQSLQQFEIARLTGDPIFGGINRHQICNADNNIKDSRLKQDPLFKDAMKTFRAKVKYPVTDQDFEL